jgi:hypothetical protein
MLWPPWRADSPHNSALALSALSEQEDAMRTNRARLPGLSQVAPGTCYRLIGTAAFAALLSVSSLAGSAAAGPCADLGGTIVGAECRITSPQNKSGVFFIEPGVSLHLVNAGGGTAGSITTGGAALTLIVNGNFTMDRGTLIDASNSKSGGCPMGGAITVTADGNVSIKPTAIVRSNACSGGPIVITSARDSEIGGLVESVGSNTSAFGTGAVAPGGGTITVESACAMTIMNEGVLSSRGKDAGADLVRVVGGCVVQVFGLVESFARGGHRVPNSPPNHCAGAFRPGKPADSVGCVEIVSGGFLLVDSTPPHNAEISADTGGVGGGGHSWIDLFAKAEIQVIGDVDPPYSVHANGLSGANDKGGTITLKTRDQGITASGFAVQADAKKEDGGVVVVQGRTNVVLNNAQLLARGDFNQTQGFGTGGSIQAKAFNGLLSWQNTLGTPTPIGDVRPTGNAVPAAQRGTISLAACLALVTAGASFPVNGIVVPPFPTTAIACGGAPAFPAYITFPDCLCALQCP